MKNTLHELSMARLALLGLGGGLVGWLLVPPVLAFHRDLVVDVAIVHRMGELSQSTMLIGAVAVASAGAVCMALVFLASRVFPRYLAPR